MATCYLVGAGEFSGELSFVPGDLLIAADGGLDALLARRYLPNILIGDMDSIRSEIPEGVEVIRHPVRKDETDMFLAYREGAARGYTDFVILGGTGGREDHTFANYSLLLAISRSGGHAALVGKDVTTYLLTNGSMTLPSAGRVGAKVSVFAFGGAARGVTLRGLSYPLEDGVMTPDFPLGVSNEFTEQDALISVCDGSLLIIAENAK